MSVKVEVLDQIVTLNPGDRLDLGESGLLVFYPEPEASAMRILHEAHVKEVRRVMEHVKSKQ